MTAARTQVGIDWTLGHLSAAISVAVLSFALTSGAEGQGNFSKTFLPSTIGPGSVSTLQFTIALDGGAGAGLENVAFADVLPAGLLIASPNAAATTCVNGVIQAPAGGNTITFSEARVGVGVTCTVTVDVTASTPGVYMNVSGDLTSTGGNAGSAVANLTVAADRPGFVKSFSPGSVSLGGRSTLTLTVDNTANAAEVTALFFRDDLPPGMTVASPSNASTTCEHPQIPATLNAAAGSSVIDFSFFGFAGFGVPAGSTCQVVVDVVGGAVGVLGNTTDDMTATVSNTDRTVGKAGAILTVASSPFAFTKSFKGDPVPSGDVVELDFSITNLDRSDTATSISFTDDLNAVLSGLSSISGSQTDVCGAGSSLGGTGTLTLAGGTLEPGATCTFSATLQIPGTASGGVYSNSTSGIIASVGGGAVVGTPATDNLFVSTPGPILSKTFTDDPVSPGTAVTLQFTIDNGNTVSALTNIAFVDELTTFLPFPVSATFPPDGFCGAGASMSLVGLGTDRQGVSMTGGSLAVGASCTFDLAIDIPPDLRSGTYVNTTDPITAMVGAEEVEGNTATDELEVVAPPTIRKVFLESVVARGDQVTLEFTLIHAEEAPGPATAIAFADDLTAVMTGLVAIDTPLGDVCGPGSQLTGTDLLSLTGGSLAAGAECTFGVTLTVPAGASYGTHVNQTNNVTATVNGMAVSGNRAEADLVVTPLTLRKEFTDDPVAPGGTVSLEFTVSNLSATDAASGIVFTDNLDAALDGFASTSGTLNDVCGSGSSISGTSVLIFSGGSLDPMTSCTFSVSAAVPETAVPDTYGNVTSNLNATVGGQPVSSPAATDMLVVSDPDTSLVLRKEFTDDPVSPGATVTLQFTISYAGPSDVSGISFTDNLDAMLPGLEAVGLPASDGCGSGSVLTGTSLLTLTGGTLGPGTSCIFSVALQVPEGVVGSFTNTTSDVTGRVGGVDPLIGSPASDDLLIEAGEGRGGSIGDFVWYDDDGDGEQNEPGSSGLSGVTVTLAAGACPGTPAQTTTTTGDGLYAFSDLSPGTYCVAVDESTITSPVPGATLTLTTGNEPLTVTLSDGERFFEADFGYDSFPVGTDPASDLPQEYALNLNYPNPFNPTTTITYDLPQRAQVTLTVFDVLGRPVRVFASQTNPAGRYHIAFDASGLPSGVYLYRLEAGDFVATEQMVLMK